MTDNRKCVVSVTNLGILQIRVGLVSPRNGSLSLPKWPPHQLLLWMRRASNWSLHVEFPMLLSLTHLRLLYCWTQVMVLRFWLSTLLRLIVTHWKQRWELHPILPMRKIFSWNVRGLNVARKQLKLASFISKLHISLFGLLETKVKRSGLGHLYHNLCSY